MKTFELHGEENLRATTFDFNHFCQNPVKQAAILVACIFVPLIRGMYEKLLLLKYLYSTSDNGGTFANNVSAVIAPRIAGNFNYQLQ